MAQNLSDIVIEIRAKDNASKVINDIKKDLQNFNKTVEELPNEIIQRFNNSINSINLKGLQTSNERVKQAIFGLQKAWNTASNSAITYNQSLQKQIEAERVLERAKQNLANVQNRISKLTAQGKTPKDKLKQAEAIATENLAKAEFQLAQAQQNTIKTGNRLDNTLLSLEKAKTNLVKANNSVAKSNEKAAKSQNKVNESFNKFNLAKLFSMIYMVRRLKNLLQDAIDVSASWVENLNLLEVTYKETSDSALGLVKAMSTSFGLDPNDIVQYSSTFMQMANAMGQARDTAYTMSTALTQVALDLASLRNVAFGQAVSDFESAIAGQVKPVRKYGMDITSFSIDDLLRRQGIAGSSTRMTMLDKQLARTILLIEQSRDAWGDYAKTINTFQNQQKVLVAQYKQLLRALGDVFVGTVNANASLEEAMKTAGIATKAIWYLNGALMALTSIIRAFKPEKMVSGFNQTTNAIKIYNEELENSQDAINGMLLSFDKFEALDSGKGMADNMTAVLESILQSEYAEYLAVAEERMANMVSYATDIRDRILEWAFPDFDSASESFEEFVKKVKEQDGVFKNINEWVKFLTAGLIALGATSVINGILNVAKAIAKIGDLSNVAAALGLTVLTYGIIKLIENWKDLSDSAKIAYVAILSVIGAIALLNMVCKVFNLTILGSPVTWIVLGIVAAVALLAAGIVALIEHWDEVVEAFKKGWDWLKENVFDPIADFFSKIGDWFKNLFGGKNKVEIEVDGKVSTIRGYRDGGFPDSGQIFMAREDGITEMVGSFGNRSAVANNDQIVLGIQQGVYNAVMSALQQNRGMFERGGGDVYIDRSKVGRVIAKSVFDEGRRAGYIKV